MTEGTRRFSVVDLASLPHQFPTQMHEGSFWESLGRTVATFGFLEEVLGKAIFAFTATRQYSEPEIEETYAAWLPKPQKALSDPLGSLITAYDRAVREHGDADAAALDLIVKDLRKAASTRNILCHGSWGPPNEAGASIPFYANRKNEIVDTTMDRSFLDEVQRHVAELACHVISSVTRMGWSFPGSESPGRKIWRG